MISFSFSSSQTVVVAALLSVAPTTTMADSVYPRSEWESLLPGCEQTDNFFDTAQCLIKNSPTQCFDLTTPRDLFDCFTAEYEWNGFGPETNHTGIVRDIMDTALDCFDPYHACITERVNAALAGLPECLRDSSMALAQCMITNVGQCFASCTGATWDSPFEDLNVFDLFSCQGIEGNLLQPMCNVVECCEPCLEPLADLAECVVNDVLDFGFFDLDCTFSCDAPTTRKKKQRDLRAVPQTTISANAEHVYETCRARVPGLFGSNQPSTQLAARSNFFDCIMEESLGLYKTVEIMTEAPTASPTPSPTTSKPAAKDDTDEEETKEVGETTSQLSANDAPSAAITVSHGMAVTGIVVVATIFV